MNHHCANRSTGGGAGPSNVAARVLELFQITGSASFAVRAALEGTGAQYATIDVHPRRRDEVAGVALVNALKGVRARRDGDVTGYETGAALRCGGEGLREARLASARRPR